MENEIKAGDVVVLKSDYSEKDKMTIRSIDDDYASCYYWIDNEGSRTLNQIDVPTVLLKKI